jgi:hypothetical protein
MSARSRKRLCLQDGSPPGGRRWLWMVVGASGVLAAQAASADPQVVLPQGLPVQVKPTYTEPGLPQFTFPTSGGSLLGGSADTGSGSGDGGTNTSSGGGSVTGSGDAYNSMMSQSWGSSAANAAGAMGISATALAATCAMESNCQNVGSSGGSSATGAFQMISSTYNADINGAVAYDPSIAGTIVSGSAGAMDPGTEAYAAAYELRQDAINLQNGEFAISNPTVLDVRAVYQFGAGAGPGVAAASDSANIAQLTGLSAASLAANGLNSSSTVGDWRQTITNKLGSATANQSVLQQ